MAFSPPLTLRQPGPDRSRTRLTHRAARTRRSSIRHALEALENRALLAIFIVNTVSDLDTSTGLPAGQVSLRQAIEDVNAETTDSAASPDSIDFDIPGSGVQTIQPMSLLPTITNPVVIDGYSQPGASPNTLAVGDNAVLLIQLDGELAGSGAFGIGLDSVATVEGLAINRFGGAGISVSGSGNHIAGNYIGTDAMGRSLVITSNSSGYSQGDGVHFWGASHDNWLGVDGYALQLMSWGDGSTVPTSGQGLVIAGTDQAGLLHIRTFDAIGVRTDTYEAVEGGGLHLVSVDAAGNVLWDSPESSLSAARSQAIATLEQQLPGLLPPHALSDSEKDQVLGEATLISEQPLLAAAQRNLISRNGWGVEISGERNVVAGNFIGTDPTGTAALPNSGGIQFTPGGVASDNRIGIDSDGLGDAAERNIISGNDVAGVGISGEFDNNIVAGNYIGLDVTGTRPIGNGTWGGVITSDVSGVGNRIERNVISSALPNGAKPGYGIHIEPLSSGSSLSGTIILGNFIGTDATGTTSKYIAPDGSLHPLGCGLGVDLSPIGGATVTGTQIEGNVIAGCDQAGVLVQNGAAGALVSGNWIGTNASGNHLGNGAGVILDTGTSTVVNNTIAYCGSGVNVTAGSTGNAIQRNSIHDNANLGIDLGGDAVYPGDGVTQNDPLDADSGPNGLQNFPVLASAYGGTSTSVVGTINSTPCKTFTLDFYANAMPDPTGYGQGQRWLGAVTVTTDECGNASFTDPPGLAATSRGEWLSATATGPSGTSEFSRDVEIDQASTVVTSSANPSVFGQAVAFTATVSTAIPGLSTPTGSVQFTVDGSAAGAPVPLVGGTASFTPPTPLTVGSHTISASYGGDASFLGSTSPAVAQAVNQDMTTTAVASSANPSVLGQTVTFTATVGVSAPGAGTPTGTVQFYDGTTAIGPPKALVGGIATLSTSVLTIGAHATTAVYSGDGNDLGSTSPALSQLVQAPTTTAVTSSFVSYTGGIAGFYGQGTVTLTATVNTQVAGIGLPDGSVQFLVDSAAYNSPVTLSNGVASISIPNLSAGEHSFQADYLGTSKFAGSNSGVPFLGINPLPTTIGVATPPTPPATGLPMTLTATVTVQPGFLVPNDTPTGTVTFYDGLDILAAGVPVVPQVVNGQSVAGTGIATLTAPAPAVGDHLIRAVFTSTNSNFTASNTFDQRITTLGLGFAGVLPRGIAADSAGNLFFVTSQDDAIFEFANFNTLESIELSGSITNFDAIAVDPSENLFVVARAYWSPNWNNGQVTPTVLKVGLDGSVTPLFALSGLLANTHASLATDTSGDLFVSYPVAVQGSTTQETINIQEYQPNNWTAPAFTTPLADVLGGSALLAVDGPGNLYAYLPSDNVTYRFATPSGQPQQVPMVPPSGGTQVGQIAADTAGDLYFGGANVEVTPDGKSGPLGLGGTYVSLDGSGNIYTAENRSNPTFYKMDTSTNLKVRSLTTADVQAALSNSQGPVTLGASSTDALTNITSAVAGLPSSFSGSITVTLAPATYRSTDASANILPINVSAPAGVTLTILCPSGSATVYDLQTSGGNVDIHGTAQGGMTIIGQSPALTVRAGQVTVGAGVTLVTAADSPTILVTGGSLTLRGATVQESTRSTQAAISVTGGTVDLGTTSDLGNNVINTNGLGTFVRNATSSLIPAVGDTFEADGAPLPAAPLLFTTLTPSANPAILNQPVTFTATVRPNVSNAGALSGSITFLDTTTGTSLGTVPLVNGVATLTPPLLSLGAHSIVAQYVGGAGYLPSLDALTEPVIYNFGGFGAPLGTGLAFALGRTVPIKFGLTAYNGVPITTTVAITSLEVAPIRSDGSYGYAFVPTSGNATGLRYDPTSKQFIFNWATKGLAAGKYAVLLALADGTMKTQAVQLKATGGSAGLTADSAGASTASTAGALLGGNVSLAVSDPSGYLTPAERARIDDAIASVDATLAPYGVAITEVDPASGPADVTLTMADTSPVGGLAQGVLGCEDDNGSITLIHGWSWYVGADASVVGAGQYDFETVVVHELGHVLGLGHRADPTSVMYATLAPGTARRVLVTADLNVPDTDGGGASGLHAAILAPDRAAERSTAVPGVGGSPAVGVLVPTSGNAPATWDAALAGWASGQPLATTPSGRPVAAADDFGGGHLPVASNSLAAVEWPLYRAGELPGTDPEATSIPPVVGELSRTPRGPAAEAGTPRAGRSEPADPLVPPADRFDSTPVPGSAPGAAAVDVLLRNRREWGGIPLGPAGADDAAPAKVLRGRVSAPTVEAGRDERVDRGLDAEGLAAAGVGALALLRATWRNRRRHCLGRSVHPQARDMRGRDEP